MTALELTLAFALGAATLLSMLWLINANRKTAMLFLLNSVLASGVLALLSFFAAEHFKLNAFSLYSTAFLGFAGIAAVYIFNSF
jgi:hypothetical protein